MKSELANHGFKNFDISLSSDRSIVYVRGVVSYPNEIEKIENIVREVPHVALVIPKVIVRSTDVLASPWPSVTEMRGIQSGVVSELAINGFCRLKIEAVTQGVFSASGTVNNQKDVDRVMNIVLGVFGVKGVALKLTVEPEQKAVPPVQGESGNAEERQQGSPVSPHMATSSVIGVWRECEISHRTYCNTWSWDMDKQQFNMRGDNGAIAVLKLEQHDENQVILSRYDDGGPSAGMTARYVGRRDGDTMQGSVTWTWQGRTWSGTWNAQLQRKPQNPPENTSQSNLLRNSGNEEPLVAGKIPGWTEVVGTNWTKRSSDPSPFEGGAYFFAGAEAHAELRQDVDVSSYETTIAAGTQQFVFEGYVRSWNQSPADTSRIIIEYRDKANTRVLTSFDSGEIVNTSSWQLVSDTRAALIETAWIRVRLISTRTAGGNNDGYYDALSLRALSTSETVSSISKTREEEKDRQVEELQRKAEEDRRLAALKLQQQQQALEPQEEARRQAALQVEAERLKRLETEKALEEAKRRQAEEAQRKAEETVRKIEAEKLHQEEEQHRAEEASDQEGERKRQVEQKDIGQPSLPDLKADVERGREYIKQMIAYAIVEGGLHEEEKIASTKSRIEALNIRDRLGRGNRKKARSLNDTGLGYIQSWQFADALQVFREAYQADPSDLEIINNLGHAYMKNGDFGTAEQFILRALALSPTRSAAWGDLGQLYANQGNPAASVACFANAYRFSRNKSSTCQFLQRLAKDGNDKEKEAASQALKLKLIRQDNEGFPKEEVATGQQSTGAFRLPVAPAPGINTKRSFTNEAGRETIPVGKRLEQRLHQEGFRKVKVRESGIIITLTGEVSSRQDFEKVLAIGSEETTAAKYTLRWKVDVVSSSNDQ